MFQFLCPSNFAQIFLKNPSTPEAALELLAQDVLTVNGYIYARSPELQDDFLSADLYWL
jgi:hypothetical protein